MELGDEAPQNEHSKRFPAVAIKLVYTTNRVCGRLNITNLAKDLVNDGEEAHVFLQPSRLNIAPKDCAAVCHEICEAQVLSLVCSEDDDGAAVERGGQKVESPDTLRFDCSSGGDGGDEGGEASSCVGGDLPLAGGGQSDAEGERVGLGGGVEHPGRLRPGHEKLQARIEQRPCRGPEEGIQAQWHLVSGVLAVRQPVDADQTLVSAVGPLPEAGRQPEEDVGEVPRRPRHQHRFPQGHKGKKVKDLPEHYLKWALAEEAKSKDMHQELSYVVAYAMVKGVGDSASSAPLPRCSQSSSDSSASQEGPPQSSVVGELSSHDDF